MPQNNTSNLQSGSFQTADSVSSASSGSDTPSNHPVSSSSANANADSARLLNEETRAAMSEPEDTPLPESPEPSGCARHPMTLEISYFIDTLAVVPSTDLPGSGSCPVCFNPYHESHDTSTPAEVPVRLWCSHVFGDQCIRAWLSENRNTCPLCRVNVFRGTLLDNTLHVWGPDNESATTTPGASRRLGVNYPEIPTREEYNPERNQWWRMRALVSAYRRRQLRHTLRRQAAIDAARAILRTTNEYLEHQYEEGVALVEQLREDDRLSQEGRLSQDEATTSPHLSRQGSMSR